MIEVRTGSGLKSQLWTASFACSAEETRMKSAREFANKDLKQSHRRSRRFTRNPRNLSIIFIVSVRFHNVEFTSRVPVASEFCLQQKIPRRRLEWRLFQCRRMNTRMATLPAKAGNERSSCLHLSDLYSFSSVPKEQPKMVSKFETSSVEIR